MATWLAALMAVAAITMTYVSCVRPMMRGHGHCATSSNSALCEELRALRAQDALESARVPNSKPTPPAGI